MKEQALYREGGISGASGLTDADSISGASGLTDADSISVAAGLIDADRMRTAGGPACPDTKWNTIYFGGGTPTYLDEDILEGIIAGVTRAPGGMSGTWEQECTGLPVPTAPEFTVEANPGTLTGSKLLALRRAGCDRLSVGAQSFDDRRLTWLGRSHKAKDFRRAWSMARAAGFTNMNLDLMYGLPDQSPEHWGETLITALSFQPEHISLYQLSIEDGTPLAALAACGQKCAADEEICRRQYLLAHEVLTDAGYRHYEISNYAKPGFESRHNTHYWRNGLYLGLGAGAAGHLPGVRYTNKADLEEYLSVLEGGALPVAEWEETDGRTALAEEMMLAFRLREGVEKVPFQERHGMTVERKYGEALEKLLRAGLLIDDGERVYPSLEGWLSYNGWITDFF